MYALTSIGGLVPFLPLFILHTLAFPARQSSSSPKQGYTPRLLLPEATNVPIASKVEIRADPTASQGVSSSSFPATSSTDIFTGPGCSSASYAWNFCNPENPGVQTLHPDNIQASCLCYGKFDFEAAASSCAQFVSTAVPQSLTDIIPLEGFCASVGGSASSSSTTTTATSTFGSFTASTTVASQTESATSVPSISSDPITGNESNSWCSQVFLTQNQGFTTGVKIGIGVCIPLACLLLATAYVLPFYHTL
jgi:hypothetical protein